MDRHDLWMARAVAEAKAAASRGEAPIAALVVRGDTILGLGYNTKTTTQSGFAHAELNALLSAQPLLGRRPQGVVLYATLEPCAMCLGAVIFAGIRTVVYGAPDRLAGAVSMFGQHPTYREWMPEVVSGVREEECQALLELPTFYASPGEIASGTEGDSPAQRRD